MNRRTPSEAHATRYSMLSRSENAGEFACGLALAATVNTTSWTVTLIASAAPVAVGGAVAIAIAARHDPARAAIEA